MINEQSMVWEDMPRLDLHCHLDGSLTQGCIETLLGRSVELSQLQADQNCESLKQYLEKFDIPLQCLNTPAGLTAGAYDFMKNIARDRIAYVEVRFAPLLSVTEQMNCNQVIEAVLSGLNRGRDEYGIEYGVIVCAMRHMSVESNREMLKTAREYLGHGVCAADLAGDEAAFPMSLFTDLFSEVKRWEMPFTIHAGECGDAENIRAAVHCGAARIGHGIAMSGHQDIISLCHDKGIGIEMCPISNMQTKAVTDIALYPLREFLDAGLLVTVNTDNRTVSGTSIEEEFRFVRRNIGITDEEVVMMTRNAVDVAFAAADVKHRLLKGLSNCKALLA